MTELIDVVGASLMELGELGPTEGEVNRSKSQLKAGLLMSLESSSARAEQMARHLLAHGRLISSSELIARVDDVTAEGIRKLAARMGQSRVSAAVVGAGARSHELANLAAGCAGQKGA